MKRLWNFVLVSIVALSLAVPAGFATPQQSQPQTQQPSSPQPPQAAPDDQTPPPAPDQQDQSPTDQQQKPKGVKSGSEKDVDAVGRNCPGKTSGAGSGEKRQDD